MGNGVSFTETRSLGPAFDAVRVRDGLTVEITLGPDNAGTVELTSDANLIPIIETTVVDGVLDITAENIEPSVLTVVRVQTITLASASAADLGSAVVVAAGIDRTGAAELGTFAVNLSEGATGDFTGVCTRLIAIVTGPSTLRARTLTCERGEFDVLDGAVVDAHVTESARVRASGASVIRLTGSPTDVERNLTADATLILE